MIEVTSDEINRNLKKLMLGLMQNQAGQIYQAHYELYNIGAMAIPSIEREIFRRLWTKINFGSELNLLSGLLRLVHDIDEDEAKRIGEGLRSQGCSEIVDSRIASITSSNIAEFVSFTDRGLTIYLSRAFSKPRKIQNLIRKWLAVVPAQDLVQIERMYIVPKSETDHSGFYVPILRSIEVEWCAPTKRFQWFGHFRVQHTLYHEIGHHVHRHTFGQIPEQEKEANRYAFLQMRKSRPFVSRVLQLLVRLASKMARIGEEDVESKNET